MAVAASFSGDWQTSLGNRRGVSATLTFSGTYTTGGESLTPANLGLGAIDVGSVLLNQGEDGYVFKYDYTNKKVLVYRSGGFTPAGTIAGTAAGQVFTGSALAGHTHTFTGDALAGHDHTSVIIDATETAGDITAFVPLLDGTGAAVAGTTIGNAGGAGADVLVPSSSDSAGTPAGTNSSDSAGTPAGTNAASALTATFTGAAVSAGPLVELANGASLTNIVTQLFASGV